MRKCSTCRHACKIPDRDPHSGLVTYRAICFCHESEKWMEFVEVWNKCDSWEDPENEDDLQ